ncbi:MAG: hypothetical protein ABIW38_04505 [Ferruginibacter sp.]
MEANIIKIGNSKGIIVPQNILKQANLSEKVVLEIMDNGLMILPKHTKARQGWAEKFSLLASKEKSSREKLPFIANSFDKTEWEW